MDANDFEAMAQMLATSDDYRILRRLKLPGPIEQMPPSDARTAIIVDVETTGLRADRDEILQLAMLKIFYADDRIVAMGPVFSALRQPTRIASIPPAITNLTGINDAMVAGKSIDGAAIAAFVVDATILIGHHVSFDAGFLLAQWPDVFAGRAWACTQTQIDWASEGFLEGTKLSYLLQQAGFFAGYHDALEDCRAVAMLLGQQLPSGAYGLQALLTQTRRTTTRLYAVGSDFSRKEDLRERGYRWNNGDDGRPRAWFIDLLNDAVEAERQFLRNGFVAGDVILPTVVITAYNRFTPDSVSA